MLRALIDLLQQRRGGVGLAELSRLLDADPAAVQGMLQLLVATGRVWQIGPDDGVCNTCPIAQQCNLLAGQTVRYVLRARRLADA